MHVVHRVLWTCVAAAACSISAAAQSSGAPQPAASTSASATVSAVIVARGVPCRSGQPFCTRERPPTANAGNAATLAEFLAAQSSAPPMAWLSRWNATTNTAASRRGDDTLTVLLIY